ncbi:uncharacterized protein G6M90_00g107320 [Metarhizium brunneum]|uniref:Uncharacterized protein n=1 Tax=Metarhizium brunneum TaxID=500148 RepID=A0A7D5Z7W5_9HYPO
MPSAQSFWIGALNVEFNAVTSMLDDRFGQDVRFRESILTCGRISAHNVVVVPLPSGSPGTMSASTEVNQMKSKFPSIKFNALIVGIGGGAPGPKRDVRLGESGLMEHVKAMMERCDNHLRFEDPSPAADQCLI